MKKTKTKSKTAVAPKKKSKKVVAKKTVKKMHATPTIKHAAIKPSLIEVMPTPIAHSHTHTDERMSFDDVYFVFDALWTVFNQDRNMDVEGADDRFVALWTLFRLSTGWHDEDEFFDILHEEHECDECKNDRLQEEKAVALKTDTKVEGKTDTKDEDEVMPIKMLPPNKLVN